MKTRFNWKCQSDHDSYRSCISSLLIEDDIDLSDVDSALDTIINGMSSAAETSIMKRSYKPYLKPYWSAEL